MVCCMRYGDAVGSWALTTSKKYHIMQGSELPDIKAIVILDTEGNRVAARFYSKDEFSDKLSQTEFGEKLECPLFEFPL